MLGMLLYATSLGIIGLVSYLWLKNYVDIKVPDLKGLKDWLNSKRGGSTAPPPPLPKRPAELEKKRTEYQATHPPGGPPPTTDSSSRSASVSSAAPPPTSPKPVVKRVESAKPVPTPSKPVPPPLPPPKVVQQPAPPSPPAKPKTVPASAAAAAEEKKEAKKEANLLSMAMAAAAPILPKRPMLNILHQPTLTKSFAPSPVPVAESGHRGSKSEDPVVSPSPDPSTSSSTSSVSKEEKMAAHREQVQWEMVSSEEKYIQSLNQLMTVYFNPLRVKAEKGSSKISPHDFALLFSNIESIWKFHQIFLPSLKTSPDGDVASVLNKNADYLKMYTKYVADYSVALNTINKLYKSQDFVKFLKKQRETPAAEGMDIMSFLIMPVQRVPRYLLLLKELQRYTPPSHPHAQSIVNAIDKISKIATHINEQQRHHENASTLLEFQHQIHNLTEDIQLLQPHRRLVRYGILKLVKQEGGAVAALKPDQFGSDFNVILFNDLILYTTLDHDFRGFLRLQGCILNTDNLLVEVVKPKTDFYRVQMSLRLETPSLDEAEKWATSLKESIAAANELGEKDKQRRSAATNSISLNHSGY